MDAHGSGTVRIERWMKTALVVLSAAVVALATALALVAGQESATTIPGGNAETQPVVEATVEALGAEDAGVSLDEAAVQGSTTATPVAGPTVEASSAPDAAVSTEEPAADTPAPNDVPIATLLYVGFGFEQSPPFRSVGGLGTTGWNIIGGDPPVLWSGLVVTEPETGWYKSKDIATIDWQLRQMERAGINVIFLSWQGWGDDNLDGVIEESINVEYDATAKMVLDHIRANNLPFKFAVLCEDFPGNYHGISLLDLTDQQRRMVMDHLWENYYSPDSYGDMAFHWDGKPLIAGGANTPGQWWEAHNFTDSRFELREIYDKPEAEDEHWTAAYYTEPPAKLPGPEGVAMIWPRHDGFLPLLARNAPWVTKETMRRVDPLGTEGAYDRAWQEVIQHAPRSDIRLIWIWIWNSYAEMTYIEPDSGLGYGAVGDLYVRKTAHYANLFRTGQPFEHFEDDDELSRYIGAVDHADPDLPNKTMKDERNMANDDIEERIRQAVAYLESSQSESRQLGMLYESPEGTRIVEDEPWQLRQTYWTQTDNLLAALALRLYNSALSEDIRATIERYEVPSASKPNIIAVLDGKVVPAGAKTARTVVESTRDDYIVLTEVQDGVDIPDWATYGNLLALQSLNQWLQGNEGESQRLYSALIGKWDGQGINDKAVQADGKYAVYKIALTLLLSKVYEDDLLDAAAMERAMWSAQAQSGGIRTDVDAHTLVVGGHTNTETTSLVLLAYDEALIQSLRRIGLQAQQDSS